MDALTFACAGAYMLERLGEPLAMAQVARHCGCSRRTMELAFRRACGMSPMAWLREQRLHLARQWLESGKAATVTEAAGTAGFSHLGRFSGLFRERFGVRPQQLVGRPGNARLTFAKAS